MIHRNVIFRNEVVPPLPTTYLEDKTGEALWRRLQADCLDREDGCDVLAIPHNSNLSAGLLFRTETEGGAPDHAARRRARGRHRGAAGGDAAQGGFRVPRGRPHGR